MMANLEFLNQMMLPWQVTAKVIGATMLIDQFKNVKKQLVDLGLLVKDGEEYKLTDLGISIPLDQLNDLLGRSKKPRKKNTT